MGNILGPDIAVCVPLNLLFLRHLVQHIVFDHMAYDICLVSGV